MPNLLSLSNGAQPSLPYVIFSSPSIIAPRQTHQPSRLNLNHRLRHLLADVDARSFSFCRPNNGGRRGRAVKSRSLLFSLL
ncbi:hypothetical protein SOVF_125870 [Spinacia oleracea]|nr:hypothetical protein SOVF_125870 [Spinacia oleracea]